MAWRGDLIAMHAGSDVAIALAYFAIPAAIWRFAQGRKDLEPEHRALAALFVAFIVACGLTHLVGAATLWTAVYEFEGLLKLATAAVSIVTAVVAWPLAPKLATLPSPKALAEANARLIAEVEAHRRTLHDLERASADLEQAYAERGLALEAARRRFSAALRHSPVVVYEQDADLRFTWIHAPAWGRETDEIVGQPLEAVFKPATVAALAVAKREAMADGEARQIETKLPTTQGEQWFDLRIEPVRGGDRDGVLCVAINVTRWKDAQSHMALVMRELTHRTKNLLAVVLSIARQTGLAENAPASFQVALSDRLTALARAHDLLVIGDWRGADLREIALAQIEGLAPEASGRVTVEGPPLTLAPQAAQICALAIHELATNACKYGALAGQEGGVRLSWSIDDGVAEVVWAENGAAAPGGPGRNGFGRRLLETLVPATLGGRSELSFAPSGLVWRLIFPTKG